MKENEIMKPPVEPEERAGLYYSYPGMGFQVSDDYITAPVVISFSTEQA